MNMNELIGLSLDSAKEKMKGKYFIRVVKLNGVDLSFSGEFYPERINVTVTNNLISQINFVG